MKGLIKMFGILIKRTRNQNNNVWEWYGNRSFDTKEEATEFKQAMLDSDNGWLPEQIKIIQFV